MSEINWKEVLNQHQLTIEEFNFEVIKMAIAILNSYMIENNGETASVDVGKYKLELTENK